MKIKLWHIVKMLQKEAHDAYRVTKTSDGEYNIENFTMCKDIRDDGTIIKNRKWKKIKNSHCATVSMHDGTMIPIIKLYDNLLLWAQIECDNMRNEYFFFLWLDYLRSHKKIFEMHKKKKQKNNKNVDILEVVY